MAESNDDCMSDEMILDLLIQSPELIDPKLTTEYAKRFQVFFNKIFLKIFLKRHPH